jgi:hypothetical protein
MNAFPCHIGFAGRSWPTGLAIATRTAVVAAALAAPARAADWAFDGGASQRSTAPVTIADESDTAEGAIVGIEPLRSVPETDSVDSNHQSMPVVSFGDTESMPTQSLMTEQQDELPMEYLVTDSPSLPETRSPRWTAQIDALLLWQTNIPSRSLFVDSVTDQTVLNANQAIPPVSAAPRYALLYHHDPCDALEINYFQIQSFAGEAAVGPGANLYASDTLPGAPFADILSAQVATTAGLKSWEFNLRRNQGGILTWLGGFRWVEWNQQMTITDQNTTGATGLDGYAVQTGNNLYGGQFGADLLLWNAHRRVKVNGLAKGGVFYNYQAYQGTTLSGDQEVPPPESNTLRASKDACSFFGEVGLTGEYKLTEWLSWRAGYTLFWLGGIATPASQLALSDFTAQTTTVNTYSSAFLHGVTTGLEARW